MKQGNSISSPSYWNCVNLQLHLLSIPNSLFSDRLRASIMSIIAFIALVASFSLKNSNFLTPDEVVYKKAL